MNRLPLALSAVAASFLVTAFPVGCSESGSESETGERVSIEMVLAEEGVETELQPTLSEYVGDARRRLFGRVLDEVSGIEWLTTAATIFLWALEIVAALVVVLLLVILVKRWPSRRDRTAESSATETIELLDEADSASAADLRERIDVLLRTGRKKEALSLLWRFVAVRLQSSGVGEFPAEKTNRECARAVRSRNPEWGRHDRLDTFVTAIDRFLYAGIDPGEAELRTLITSADELVS